jgi:hypothetical protein
MLRSELIQYLRGLSVRCRAHAEAASDPEAADALREVATEMAAVAERLEDWHGGEEGSVAVARA